MTAKLSLESRTFSADNLPRQQPPRTKSTFDLRKKSDPEPLFLSGASPPPVRKRSVHKISKSRPSVSDWNLDHLDEFANALPPSAYYEKALIQKIQQSTTRSQERLILLRQWIENPATRELVAPEKDYDRSGGYLEIYMLPTPDVLSFPLEEVSRPFTSGELQHLHFAFNGESMGFQEEDDAELAILQVLKKAEESGWVFRDSDSPEKLTIAVLNHETTQISRLLQASTMNARGDATALLRLKCTELEYTLEQQKNSLGHRILNIDFFIFSKDLFTVLHHQPFKVINAKGQEAFFDFQVAVTYDHGNWKNAFYITQIKGEFLPLFKQLHELSKNQRQPRKHPLTRKSTPLPDLTKLLLDIQTMNGCPAAVKGVTSIEELYVLNETFITNRPIHQKITERLPMESMRALKTFSKIKPSEVFPLPNKEKAALKYLSSENFFNDIDTLLWQKIGDNYRVDCTLLQAEVKTYKEADDYFTKTISVLVTCMKKTKEVWTCHMHGAVTYQHHQWTVHTLLTNFSIIRKMRRWEPLFIEYEKACNPIA